MVEARPGPGEEFHLGRDHPLGVGEFVDHGPAGCEGSAECSPQTIGAVGERGCVLPALVVEVQQSIERTFMRGGARGPVDPSDHVAVARQALAGSLHGAA